MPASTYRPPLGIPNRERTRWQGWVVSLLAHAVVLFFLLVPVLQTDADLGHAEGAGGVGPVGGGGGGESRGGAQERVRFVQVPAQRTAPSAPIPHPVVPPVPPPPTPPPAITPPAPKVAPTPTAPVATTPAASAGAGNGTSTGAGAGPGTGGGVGSGEGTGRGTGTGPGTGGGRASIYPPSPVQFFLPPLPAPRALHGFQMTAWFDVDSTGKATLLRFTPSPDRGYNARLRETLLQLRFRPAVRQDGVPVRDTVDVKFTF